jgi:hypothetical protein
MTEHPSKQQVSLGARIRRIWRRINAVDTFLEILIIVAMVAGATGISLYRCVASSAGPDGAFDTGDEVKSDDS